MRWVMGALLITAAMAGCLGTDRSDEADPAPEEQEEEPASTGGCNTNTASGAMTPGEPLSVTVDAGGAPAAAEISVALRGTGSVDLALERGDQTVWDHSATSSGVGSYNYGTSVQGLDAGTYTLTASTDGVRNGTLELAMAWGQATC